MIQTDPSAVVFSFFGPSVFSASSTRQVTESRRSQFLQDVGLDPKQLVVVEQVHGDGLVWASPNHRPAPKFEADGLLTASPGLVLAVKTADCIPVFLYDPQTRIGGIIHAGWRGLKGQILPKALRQLQKRGAKAETLQAAFGPCIRKCCYEVGEEFEGLFPAFYELGSSGKKGRMDLVACARDQILGAGVRPQNVQDCGICNACENRTFFSVRREPATPERILSVFSICP